MRTVETHILVIGSGVAGLAAAIAAADGQTQVLLVDKGLFGRSGSTVGAEQVAATGPWSLPGDGPDVHFHDTVVSGQFLADQRLARLMVDEVAERIEDLMRWGLRFDREPDGSYVLAPINGHSYPRSLCCRADCTGLAMSQLMKRVARERGVQVLEETLVTRLVQSGDAVVGATALDTRRGELVAIQATATVLASGGIGQLYGFTTNPIQCTGDGYALCLRLGLPLQDMEMVQFVVGLIWPPALRGYGVGLVPFGKLYNRDGERYMARYQPERLEDTTRDAIADALAREIRAGRGSEHGGVLLDVTGLSEDVYALFESSFRVYAAAGLDPRRDRLEVGPSAHYHMGGVPITPAAETGLRGLYAAGEVAGGVHGANRLGNNSLTDGLVFGHRAGQAARRYAATHPAPPFSLPEAEQEARRLDALFERQGRLRPLQARERLQRLVRERLGVLRDEAGLRAARSQLRHWQESLPTEIRIVDRGRVANQELISLLELENLLLVARAVAEAALARRETRGAHRRDDYPDLDDARWLKNTLVWLGGDELRTGWRDAVLVELQPQPMAQ